MVALLKIRVQPGAKRSRVVGKLGDLWKIAIQAPPVDGKANAALVQFLSEARGVSRAAIEIKRGSTSRTKTIAIEGLALTAIEETLSAHRNVTSSGRSAK